ncbi:MAG: cell division protein ZapA [Candidatus Marinimicrobia bacterium]|nr:cell division protein ZapA [Candidatus Neomarinimicrobiota bacterium]
MENAENLVKVDIYGKEYTVKGQADSSYIESVAEYVDSKMKEVDANVPFESSLRVAILAAMNITDELFSQKSLKNVKNEDIEEKARILVQELEDTLESTSAED